MPVASTTVSPDNRSVVTFPETSIDFAFFFFLFVLLSFMPVIETCKSIGKLNI